MLFQRVFPPPSNSTVDAGVAVPIPQIAILFEQKVLTNLADSVTSCVALSCKPVKTDIFLPSQASAQSASGASGAAGQPAV